MTVPTLSDRLAEPFHPHEIEWRVQSSGKTRDGKPWVRVLAYVTNRAIMDRLDHVCGIDGWRNEYRELQGGGLLCGISIRVSGEWITKWDGADKTDIESTKGGLSNAMKRAAVQWGIGRYLYHLEEAFAIIAEKNDSAAEYLKANPQKHGDALKWRPPRLPHWAVPGGSGNPDTPAPVRAVVPPPMDDATPVERPKLTVHDGVRLPGTKSSLLGHGGKLVVDVETADLLKIKPQIEAKNTDNKYRRVLDAIDIVLDDRRIAEEGQ